MDKQDVSFYEGIQDKYLSIKEAAEILEVGEDEVRALIDQHKITPVTVAGAFLRLKKDEINHLKAKWRLEREELFPDKDHFFSHEEHAFFNQKRFDRIRDFWYFNDFYVYCITLVVVLMFFIITS